MHRWTCTHAHTRTYTWHLQRWQKLTQEQPLTSSAYMYPWILWKHYISKGSIWSMTWSMYPAKKLRISLDIFSQHWNAGATLVHCYLPGTILPKFSSNLLLDQSACMVVFHIQRPAPFHFGNSTNHGGLWQKRTHLGNFGNFSFHCAKLTNRNRNCFEQFWRCSWWNSFQLPRLPQLATATCAIMTFTYQLSILPCYISFRHGVANASMP